MSKDFFRSDKHLLFERTYWERELWIGQHSFNEEQEERAKQEIAAIDAQLQIPELTRRCEYIKDAWRECADSLAEDLSKFRDKAVEAFSKLFKR